MKLRAGLPKSIIWFFMVFFFAHSLFSAENLDQYSRSQILKTRFGDGETQELLQKLATFKKQAFEKIVGQRRVLIPLISKLESYLKAFKTHKGKPFAAHLLGLEGLGKDLIVNLLEEMGFNIVRVDFGQAHEIPVDVFLDQDFEEKKPTILFINEIDKQSVKFGDDEEPDTNSDIVPQLSALLSNGDLVGEGTMAVGGGSHLFVITAMNIDSGFLKEFDRQKKGDKPQTLKFQRDIEELKEFDRWLADRPNAKYEILGKTFPRYLVGRIAPDVLTLEPFSIEDYRALISMELKKVATNHSSNEGAFVEIAFDRSVEDFFMSKAIVPVSGARETIAKVQEWGNLLVSLGLIAIDKTEPPATRYNSMAQGRSIVFSRIGDTDDISIQVAVSTRHGKKLVPKAPFSVKANFNKEYGVFELSPEDMGILPDMVEIEGAASAKNPLKKEVRAARSSVGAKRVKGLGKFLKSNIFGIGALADRIEDEFLAYMSRPGASEREPSALALQGLTGTGKSTIFILCAQYLGLPYLQVNLKNFMDTDSESVSKFVDELKANLAEIRKKRADGKFIVFFDELDKLAEKDGEGEPIDRPIMGVINDILNDGFASVSRSDEDKKIERANDKINLRAGFVGLTLNLGNKNLGFSADPRLTSIEDIQRIMERLQESPADRESILKLIFRDETVRRIFPILEIIPAVSRENYSEILEMELVKTVSERLTQKTGPFEGKDITNLKVEFTTNYKNFIFSESIIPSQGPGGAVHTARRWLRRHLESALAHFPKGSDFWSKPATVLLDYDPMTREFIGSAKLTDESSKAKEIVRTKVNLNFPSLEKFGEMSEYRIFVGVHEFGHAYGFARLGSRFEDMINASIESGTGGFVSSRSDHKKDEPLTSLKSLVADTYIDIASRAMERIFLSDNPRDTLSRLDITDGSYGDIKMVTHALYQAISLGADIDGGFLNREFNVFAPIPDEMLKKMGLINRDLENFMVDDFLSAHDQNWFRDKIRESARLGHVKEKKFYNLIGYAFPGENAYPVGDISLMRQRFAGHIVNVPKIVEKARQFKQGNTQTTAAENLARYVKFFSETVRKHLHPELVTSSCQQTVGALVAASTK